MLARAAARWALSAQEAAPITAVVSRSLSASAAAADKPAAGNQQFKLPDAPTSLSGTSAAIATLTWQIARKENKLDVVQEELHQMVDAFAEFKELRKIAVDPFVPKLTKKNIIDTVLQDSGASQITKLLFSSLAEENCLTATLQISNNFDTLMLAHKKEVHCTVVTAEPLDKLEKVELRKRAEKFVEPGFKLITQEKVDKKLLGGFQLHFADRLVDMSVSKKLEEFNDLVFKLESDLAP